MPADAFFDEIGPKRIWAKKKIGTQATFNAVIKQKVGRFFEDGQILHLSDLDRIIYMKRFFFVRTKKIQTYKKNTN